LNKVRSGAVPGDVKAELTGALQRFAGCLPAALLPFDHVSLDVAVASGRSLADARASSPLRRAVGVFAAELAGVPVRPARRRVRGHRG
jgi:MinD-like ATPase involved in chromosome partitioning or flagellar assembly